MPGYRRDGDIEKDNTTGSGATDHITARQNSSNFFRLLKAL
jgi:hypothetical protein